MEKKVVKNKKSGGNGKPGSNGVAKTARGGNGASSKTKVVRKRSAKAEEVEAVIPVSELQDKIWAVINGKDWAGIDLTRDEAERRIEGLGDSFIITTSVAARGMTTDPQIILF